jgi:protein TonB
MFQTMFSPAPGRTVLSRNALALGAAVGAHLVFLAGVMAAQLWTIEPVDEPPILVTLRLPREAAPPPPPPPPPPRAGGAIPREEPRKQLAPAAVAQPAVVPTAVPAAAVEPGSGEGGAAGGAEGGVPGGVVGGVAGGEVGGEVGGEAGGELGGVPGGVPGAPLRVGLGQIREPRRKVYVPPDYPEPARRDRVEGTVILDITIDRDGTVRDVRVLRPVAGGLTEAAIAAVKQWAYEPTTLDGQPVAVAMTVMVTFNVM